MDGSRNGIAPCGRHAKLTGVDQFDYIVIGAGSAGCVLVDRLSAAGRRVLILEAGGSDSRFWIRTPIGYGRTFADPSVNWRYNTLPSPGLDGRTMYWPRGRVLGGSSSINALVYCRGMPQDFDDWRSMGNTGWGWDDVQPYFERSERRVDAAGHARTEGALDIKDVTPLLHATRANWLQAARELGVPLTDDFNGAAPEGLGCYQLTIRDGRRRSAADAFLRPALRRDTVKLEKHAWASKIRIVAGRATGVEWIDAAGERHVETAGHVVLAAGATETPRLLLLSGLDHPEVGRNLMYHFQTLTFGQLPMRLHAHKGRSVTHLQDDFILVDKESRAAATEAGLPWFKGGLVEHGAAAHPMLESKFYPWGPDHKDMMRASPMRDHMVGFTMQGEDLPQATNRIDLDPSIRDIHGLPVARITYKPHRHEIAASAYYGPKLEGILNEAGAVWARTATSPHVGEVFRQGSFKSSSIPASRHVVGTARMGTDPATSVCDEWGRLHDVPNVVVCDSSPFPTGAGYGPTLTLVALSIRNSRALTT